MKRSLIALSALAASSVFAQSSVTLFGVVDATIALGRGSIANKTHLTNSGNASSRLGFRGTEDLGGGMSASFWLEAGVNNDNGTGGATNVNNQATGGSAGNGLTFNRRSTVSLAGGWGELRLGRDYTPQFYNLTLFDPFGTVGTGANQALLSGLGGPVAVRASNGIGYFLPSKLAGFEGYIQHYRGENNSSAPNSGDGTGTGVRVGYASGPARIAVAYSSTNYLTGDIRQANIGGEWRFGIGKIVAMYSRDRVASPAARDGRGGLIGGLIPFGPGEFRVSYSTYRTDAAGAPKSSKWAVGYVHNLSKRTALYATYARVGNSGGAAQALNGSVTAPNGSSRGYDFGLRHSF